MRLSSAALSLLCLLLLASYTLPCSAQPIPIGRWGFTPAQTVIYGNAMPIHFVSGWLTTINGYSFDAFMTYQVLDNVRQRNPTIYANFTGSLGCSPTLDLVVSVSSCAQTGQSVPGFCAGALPYFGGTYKYSVTQNSLNETSFIISDGWSGTAWPSLFTCVEGGCETSYSCNSGNGIQSLTAGTGISISSGVNPTIANTGVISTTAGTGMTQTGTAANPIYNNAGVLSTTAGTGIVQTGTAANPVLNFQFSASPTTYSFAFTDPSFTTDNERFFRFTITSVNIAEGDAAAWSILVNSNFASANSAALCILNSVPTLTGSNGCQVSYVSVGTGQLTINSVGVTQTGDLNGFVVFFN